MRRCGSPAPPSACDSSGNRLVRSSRCPPPCLLRTKKAAWEEIERELQTFQGATGFEAPAELVVGAGTR